MENLIFVAALPVFIASLVVFVARYSIHRSGILLKLRNLLDSI